MSTTAISNPVAYVPNTTRTTQPNSTTIRSKIQQLGTDLQAGNLAAAQQDYVTLSQNGPLANAQSTNPLVQDLQAVGAALQGGNLAGAQQAFSTFQQAAQNQGNRVHGHGHHHHGGGGQSNSELSQAFSSLEQAVQSGNMSSAQAALSALQQDLQQFGVNFGTQSTNNATSGGTQTAPATGGLSVTA